jgi:3-hydroxyisobutyrate dehydrogenase-like beta-hydroxyacid dehydrogenase
MDLASLRSDLGRKEYAMKLGFVGLGNMGHAMARVLLRGGYEVAVWDRSPAKGEDLVKEGARLATSPADAAREAEVALSSLPDDRVVSAVVLGDDGDVADRADREPLIRGLESGATHASLSTISPAMSRRLDEAHRAAGQRYVAAPVVGRPEAAERGELVLLVAGQDQALEGCKPLFDLLSSKTYRLGSQVERASVMKVSANLVMASLLEVFGETFALAESHGLGAMQVLGVLKDTMLSPQALASYGERIAQGRFEPAGFRLKHGLKDVDLALSAGEAGALQLPFASALRDRFLVAMAQGLGDKDWAAVARTLPHKRAA